MIISLCKILSRRLHDVWGSVEDGAEEEESESSLQLVIGQRDDGEQLWGSAEFLLCVASYNFQEIRLHIDFPQNLTC